MTYPSNLRYSPLNWLIVDWGFNGQSFDMCGLPPPLPCPEHKGKGEPCGCPIPIREAIDTYDWAKWLPEVIVGIEDPDEEIAANYVREAAIEFCKSSRVLQRIVTIPLQPKVCNYPIIPYEDETVVGAISAEIEDVICDCGDGCRARLPRGVDFFFDAARNEVTLSEPVSELPKTLRVLVWSMPSEHACDADVFLYDNFRKPIAQEARRAYATAVHFRDRMLLASLSGGFSREILLAKRRAYAKRGKADRPVPNKMWSRRG